MEKDVLTNIEQDIGPKIERREFDPIKNPKLDVKKESEGFLTKIIRNKVTSMLDNGSAMNYYYPESTLNLIRRQKYDKDVSICYVSKFTSLWDTFVIPYGIESERVGGDLPMVLMKSTLMSRFKFISSFANKHLKNSRILLTGKNDGRMQSRSMIRSIDDVLSTGDSMLVFPEGTRSRTGEVNKFKPGVFKGIVDASRNYDVKIVPVNIDYSSLLEMTHLLNNSTNYALAYFGLKNWTNASFGKVYITFGRPIDVNYNDDYVDLAKKSKFKCLDLVKIQPINIASEALLRLDAKPGSYVKIYGGEFSKSIDLVLNDVRESRYKFRGFDLLSSSTDIVSQSNYKIIDGYLQVTGKLLNESKFYSNQISQYFKNSKLERLI